MKKTLCLLALWCAQASALPGTGSVDFKQAIIPLLDAQPALKQYVLCHVEIVSDPMGTRVGGVAMPHLAGAVMGPFSMWANLRGPNGPVKVVLTVNTNVVFLDKVGRPITDGRLAPAVRWVETFANLEIEPPDQDQPLMVPGGLKYHADAATCGAKP